MDHLISMYIDDELSLDEKIVFVRHVNGNKHYSDEAIVLLEQEKILSAALTHSAPAASDTFTPVKQSRSLSSIGLALAACVMLVVSFLAGSHFTSLSMSGAAQTVMVPTTVQHRFVLLQKGAAHVEIAGSFTDWRKVPLMPTGSGNYWEVILDVPHGEHRYSFIVDGTQLLTDPTVSARESDDFGTMNSVINVES